jgi:uncharacterized membrane protein
MTTLRRTIAAALAVALVLAALALAGFIAQHIPTILAFIGFGVLLMMAAARVEGRP